MGAETVVTLVAVLVVVAALAGYLITIAVTLRDVSFTLGTILIGVRSIANQTVPLRGVIGDIVNDVASMDAALKGVLSRGQLGAGGREALPAGGARGRRTRSRR